MGAPGVAVAGVQVAGAPATNVAIESASAPEAASVAEAEAANPAEAAQDVAGAQAGGPEEAAQAPVPVAGVQVAGPLGFAAGSLALPATGQPVMLFGAGFLALAGAGALLRRRRRN